MPKSKFQSMRTFVAGAVAGGLIVSAAGATFASTQSANITAQYHNIKLVVDGTTVKPTDATGKAVEPFIAGGSVFLPVRAVAAALGKGVYWDAPNYTVYVGEMGGATETLSLAGATNIAPVESRWRTTVLLTDNKGNVYNHACGEGSFKTLLNENYSRFEATLYIPKGTTSNHCGVIEIETDGKVVYTSPAMTASSAPVKINLDVNGCSTFIINGADFKGCVGEGVFYK